MVYRVFHSAPANLNQTAGIYGGWTKVGGNYETLAAAKAVVDRRTAGPGSYRVVTGFSETDGVVYSFEDMGTPRSPSFGNSR
ncbi:MAG: hypothetical protein JWO38_6385 [Gemmataceae bacterium]|nr:hypothetical protein [Gemmataceae bacterium]